MRMMYRTHSPVLPLGPVNLKTGASKLFNVYDTWKDDMTAEIWKPVRSSEGEARYVVLFTSYSGDEKKPDHQFMHDQTQRPLFQDALMTMVDSAPIGKLKDLADVYGKSLKGYVYK